MTDTELWEAIREHNRRQKLRERKLTELEALLPPPDRMLPMEEVPALLRRIRQILTSRL